MHILAVFLTANQIALRYICMQTPIDRNRPTRSNARSPLFVIVQAFGLVNRFPPVSIIGGPELSDRQQLTSYTLLLFLRLSIQCNDLPPKLFDSIANLRDPYFYPVT